VSSVAFSPDGKWIAAGSDAQLQVWDASSYQKIGYPRTLAGPVHGVAFSPDSRRIVTGGDGGTVRVWDRATGTEDPTLAGHEPGTPVRSVAFSPGGDLIASGGGDTSVRLWDARTGRQAAAVKSATTVTSLAFSRTGERLVVGRVDGTVEAQSGHR
jgi:WD40 repeat protein